MTERLEATFTYACPTTGKVITLPFGEMDIEMDKGYCCGGTTVSHFEVLCECNKMHEIKRR